MQLLRDATQLAVDVDDEAQLAGLRRHRRLELARAPDAQVRERAPLEVPDHLGLDDELGDDAPDARLGIAEVDDDRRVRALLLLAGVERDEPDHAEKQHGRDALPEELVPRHPRVLARSVKNWRRRFPAAYPSKVLRSRLLAALMLFAACGTRPPHRFASPMMGTASVPPAPLPHGSREEPALENRASRGVRAAPIRVSSAPRIREASAAAAEAVVAASAVGREDTRGQLPAPNRIDAAQPLPPARVPAELRALVGRRDKRDPIEAALGWARELGMAVEPDVVAWAEANGRLHDASTPPERGDLLVFDRVNSDDPADLVGVVITRDERSVTEFLYLGGGVIRRGFVDTTRPRTKRDKTGAIVNTFLRTGKRWPAKGSHYLAGEHLAHVIR